MCDIPLLKQKTLFRQSSLAILTFRRKPKNGRKLSQLQVALVVHSPTTNKTLFSISPVVVVHFPTQYSGDRELIKLCGSFYSSSKTMKFIHNIRIIELIYIRHNMNVGTGTVFCFIVGQMTLLELCRFRHLSGLVNEEKLCKFVRRYVQSTLIIIFLLLRTARVSTCIMHRISAFMWRIFLGKYGLQK